MSRITKQIHIPKTTWDNFDERVGDRNRSSGIDALCRALEAGDVKNFDKHHNDVRAEIAREQSERLAKNRGR